MATKRTPEEIAAYKRAKDKEWRERNKARAGYVDRRGAARNFIKNHADEDDLRMVIEFAQSIIDAKAWHEAPQIEVSEEQLAEKAAKAEERARKADEAAAKAKERLDKQIAAAKAKAQGLEEKIEKAKKTTA